ncbi:hypothetical protein SUGI_1114570 [Cryptomeria japonica]|uniref:uncharacterized protein LOC131070808 n=1 Tax=Cryptomeria japonica TaxID=3369 RepID=UPI002414A7B3|nr:uncharacterized protein LOC131070808 [Cryptomeria japonica]GLJ52401.1 hypothetical protein SUGI_1114570 [Cryptomeria japonica]
MAKASAALDFIVLLYIWVYCMQCTVYGSSHYGFWASRKISTVIRAEKELCLLKGKCYLQTVICPPQCPQRKPADPKAKACFVDCGPKCEPTCKNRVPTCNGYGSICYDPRFIGGDGVMFYFHGSKGNSYSLVHDPTFHVNGHLIGTRPVGRPRDYTWIDSLAILIPSHTLTITSIKASTWDDNVDHLSFSFDNNHITLEETHVAEWRSLDGLVRIERTSKSNSAVIYVAGKAEINVKAGPITEQDNRVHNYQIPSDDCFVHLDVQFKFFNLSSDVEGILGKTYRPGYVSPVKRGVSMPIMGGEDRYKTSSLLSIDCVACNGFGSLEKQSTTLTAKESVAEW